MNLAAHNIAYRRPDLYDALTRDSTSAATCKHLIDQYGTADTGSVLDLGCGTGRDLAQLATTHHCVGVDFQPALIDHARQRYPELALHVGDLRTVRLGTTFDTITCLGNTLAYLHHNNDIQAAFTTFAAHGHPGTLLIIVTQIAPTTATPSRSRIDVAGVHADVTTEYNWDPHTHRSPPSTAPGSSTTAPPNTTCSNAASCYPANSSSTPPTPDSRPSH